MRYRMEVIEDELIIRNVETDVRLGTAIPYYAVDTGDPNRPLVLACNVLNSDAVSLAKIAVPNPLGQAAVVIANHEAHNGYPGLKKAAKGCNPHRVEWLLARTLADAVSVVARACIEYRNGGLKSETKTKYADLIDRLHDIWYASRFGSFDGERRVDEPYFANTDPDGDPRISFAEAARQYGMHELRMRFPEESDETLKEVLSWPLDLLRDTLDRLSRYETDMRPSQF